jgi:myo-inositol 2-dehydrogenase / D-chiro-inositol 1-dehydrogenase
MGRRHIEMVRNLGLNLVGVSDVDDGSLALAGSERAVPAAKQFSDARTMLQATAPECVVIASTAPSHCEYACMAAEAGARFILCEKPMAVSVDQCATMIRVCAERGARLAINHQMRFMRQYTEPKRLLESPEFGGLTSATVIAGNIGMNMNGIHFFEMFRFLTDEAPATVAAWLSRENVPNPRGPQYVDRAGAIRISTPSGKRFYLEAGADQGHGIIAIYAARYGQIVVDECAVTLRYSARLPEHRQQPTTRYGMPWVEHSEKLAANVVEGSGAVMSALLAGENFPTGEDGCSAVATLVAAYVSDENGHMGIDPASPDLPTGRIFPWA